jgi:hypothetical protein
MEVVGDDVEWLPSVSAGVTIPLGDVTMSGNQRTDPAGQGFSARFAVTAAEAGVPGTVVAASLFESGDDLAELAVAFSALEPLLADAVAERRARFSVR